MYKLKIILYIVSIIFIGCHSYLKLEDVERRPSVKTGLDVLMDSNIHQLKNKNIALVTNQSGINRQGESNVSLLLAEKDVNIVKIFSPEHGYRGTFSNGERVINDIKKSDLPPIISLYGDLKKPSKEMLDGIDLILYDIQDVGARFYTYISTLGLVMEAAAEANVKVMVLDRPNPIGHSIEGPILNTKYVSFVGKYPVPIRYGMTIGEFAQMIADEKLIESVPQLSIIKMENYIGKYYDETNLPWVKPSPNIPDLETAIIYSGVCILEATNISEGRGTHAPFKQIGAPWIDSNKLIKLINEQKLPGVLFNSVEFIPKSIATMSKFPKYENDRCYGISIRITDREKYKSILTGITILWAINKLYSDKLIINRNSLARLWGSETLQQQLTDGLTPLEIVRSYEKDLQYFIELRNKFRLYH